MNIFQTCGSFLGMIAGAVFGAMLANRRGTFAYVGAALAGGLAEMLAGALLGQLAYGFLSLPQGRCKDLLGAPDWTA